MKTVQDQQAFFEKHRDALRAALETDGAPGAVRWIEGFEDDLERRVLYVFGRQGLVMEEWEGRSFDAYVEFVEAGLADILKQAEAAPDDETRTARHQTAHAVSFNLAADLAECWPDDDDPRETRHFERGVRAAEDCLTWCAPDNLHAQSADHWILGTHRLSLGDASGAAESFGRAFEIAGQAARDGGKPDTVSAEGDFAVILYSGYLGIAQERTGDAAGGSRFDRAVAAFTAQLGDAEMKDDAEFGIAQLKEARAIPAR